MLTIKITTGHNIKRKYPIQRLQKLRKNIVEKESDLFFCYSLMYENFIF